jgi:hypothetical protein
MAGFRIGRNHCWRCRVFATDLGSRLCSLGDAIPLKPLHDCFFRDSLHCTIRLNGNHFDALGDIGRQVSDERFQTGSVRAFDACGIGHDSLYAKTMAKW